MLLPHVLKVHGGLDQGVSSGNEEKRILGDFSSCRSCHTVLPVARDSLLPPVFPSQSDTGGDYRRCLLALVGGGSR